MQKHIIISVLWDNNGQPSVSFFSFPINCSLEDEDTIRLMVKEHNNFQKIQDVARVFHACDTLQETTDALITFEAGIPKYDTIGIDFINCPDDKDIEDVLIPWIKNLQPISSLN